jgi:SAM-dependent methyltransferase
LKFDLDLFSTLNEEYRSKPLVRRPPLYIPAELTSRASRRAADLASRYNVAGHRTLEIGCGRGEVCRALATEHGCDAVGFDITRYPEWSQNVPRATLLQGDLTTMETSHLGQFDFVYSYSVWEHIRHPYTMLRQVFGLMNEGASFFLSANLYRGPKASHRYREVFFPWPHLLFQDQVFREYYQAIGLPPRGPAWVNQLSIADYLRYFELVGFQVVSVNFSITKIDEPFYERFSNVLERVPRYDLERDFINVHLRKPTALQKMTKHLFPWVGSSQSYVRGKLKLIRDGFRPR